MIEVTVNYYQQIDMVIVCADFGVARDVNLCILLSEQESVQHFPSCSGCPRQAACDAMYLTSNHNHRLFRGNIDSIEVDSEYSTRLQDQLIGCTRGCQTLEDTYVAILDCLGRNGAREE